MIRDTMLELRDFFLRHRFCADGVMARDALGNEVGFDSSSAESFCFYGALGVLGIGNNGVVPYDFEVVCERRAESERNLKLAIWNYFKDDMGYSDGDMPEFYSIIIFFQEMIGNDSALLWRFLDSFNVKPALAAAD